MGEAICSIEGCAKRLVARGWCGMHWARWKRHGDPTFTERPQWGQPIEVRFFGKVDAFGVCWQWTGPTSRDGYGLWDGGVRAHLWSWRHLVGPVPDGLQLDHLCRNKACVNPDHLEPVTIRENVLRSGCPQAINARKTHCPRGHPYDEENTRIYTRPGGRSASRYCIACSRGNGRKRASA